MQNAGRCARQKRATKNAWNPFGKYRSAWKRYDCVVGGKFRLIERRFNGSTGGNFESVPRKTELAFYRFPPVDKSDIFGNKVPSRRWINLIISEDRNKRQRFHHRCRPRKLQDARISYIRPFDTRFHIRAVHRRMSL